MYHNGKNGSTAAVQSSTAESLTLTLQELRRDGLLPKLLVFDLDNTLWTPELYQLDCHKPVANRDIHLFPDVNTIFQCLLRHWHEEERNENDMGSSEDNNKGCDGASTTTAATSTTMRYAVASRATEDDWAHDLIDQFPIIIAPQQQQHHRMRDLFPDPRLVYIACRSKQWRLEQIRAHAASTIDNDDTTVTFADMIFYDDDLYLNLEESSQMGVFSCHTPRGLTLDVFEASLRRFAVLKKQTAAQEQPAEDDEPRRMGQIVNRRSLGL